MTTEKIYPMLIAKAGKKGCTKADVDKIACWLIGYGIKFIF
ncbi:MAG: DUF2200 domain-containing protein [Lachnospiraceae bacterium]|nr:DUF2200 domain-containing protein [Lachnospiraceae bacterium]